MDNKQLAELFDRYMNGASSEDETHTLFNYINNPENARQVKELLGKEIDHTNPEYELPKHKGQLILDQIFEHEVKPEKKPRVRSLIWLRIAAATLIFILPATYFLMHRQSKTSLLTAKTKERHKDVPPGGNKAILTLSDGSKIILDNAKNGTLARQGNTNIIKLANGRLAYNKTTAAPAAMGYNTMTTPRGGKYDLVLSDGTRVWLNAASSITYPTVFTGTERKVSITGEAYFEVYKNKKMPFKVNVGGKEEIQVLGTHFNVMAYTDEDNVKTTLLEGSVKIVKDELTGILKPGQQASLTHNGNLSINDHVDINEAIAWKNGQTLFVDEDIKTIMRQVSRWYDVDVEYRGDIPSRLFTGGISRESSLSAVLSILELSKVHFKVQGNKIIVTG